MGANSTSASSSIFEDGRVKPGIYKIQNLYHQNYLDVQEHSRRLCCRSARDLEDGRGLWEIRHLGVGYTIQRVEPGKPDQFCNPLDGLDNGTPLYVAAYPIAWRIEVVDDNAHRGFEYVRFYWGTTKRAWDLCRNVGIEVTSWMDTDPTPWRIWKLTPSRGTPQPSQALKETFNSGCLPSYYPDAAGLSSTEARHANYEGDDFGTIVTEVTTVITRKRYRVEGT